ncbi:TPA: methyltransferase [Candidatus Woesearchaeota archaeon]|nr:Methylase [archaeon GW2011_AR15]MBS3104015.1 methyltransferase [Candidatus Woesearchaeota archaeon]HIH40918.1 methyltransferase [Candidatus Woesearchaeota archaeon]
MEETVYEPREDSYLLQKYVEEYSKGSVLDMGTGSGIQAIAAAKNARGVIAADINPEAVNQTRLTAEIEKLKNIKAVESDLFEKVPKKKFDLICFNPPYLPKEKNIDDIALFSARRGTGTTTKFLDSAADYLKKDGIILLVNSSIADQNKINKALEENLLDSVVVEKEHRFFEDIFVMRITKSPLLKKLDELGIRHAMVFAHGKRGVIIAGDYKKKKVAVKVKKTGSTAQGTIENEASFLKKLNRKGIGPKLIMAEKDFLVYEFAEGSFIEEFFEKGSKRDIILVLKKLFEQLYTMDKMGINKFEMHHPVKHIIIKNNSPVLIDFERCRYTEEPKNVTQFCDFLIGDRVTGHLKKKNINLDKTRIIELARQYKENQTKANFMKILEELK